MRAIHLTTCHLRHSNHLKIAVLSDLHFSPTVKTKKLHTITNFLRAQHPDYILFPGDLLDANDNIKDSAERSRLLHFIQTLGYIAPTFITLGNHDLFCYADRDYRQRTRNRWRVGLNRDFFNRVSNLKNVHLLENRFWCDNNIAVYGLALPPEYYPYTQNGHHVDFLHPSSENLQVLQALLEKLAPASILPSSDTLNFMLVHSPVLLSRPEVQPYLQPFDYLVSGHMHNGLVPPLLNELWPSDRGFIAPAHQKFTPHARLTATHLQKKPGLVISGAVTSLQKCSGPLQPFNALYPVFLTLLDFSPDYTGGPIIRRRYYRM